MGVDDQGAPARRRPGPRRVRLAVAGSAGSGGRLDVVASFYPLQYAAQRVGGDVVSVTNLTAPGAEPHDLELTPRDVAAVSDADLVVYLAGFQPAVDDAVKSEAGRRPSTSRPPPAWISPAFRTTAATRRGDRPALLARPDPAGRRRRRHRRPAGRHRPGAGSTFTGQRRRAAHRPRRPRRADDGGAGVLREQRPGHQPRRVRLPGPAATGCIQVGIAGLSPEAEPDAATLARSRDFVRSNSVRPSTTRRWSARTSPGPSPPRPARAPPCSTRSRASPTRRPHADYLDVMRANLAALQDGQPCP